MNIGSLDLQLQQADPSLIQFLIQQAEQAIASKQQQENIAQKLHLIIAEYLRIQQQAPKLEDIAQELHVSVRTLQRQLGELDTSFKRILEIERMQQCEKLLLKDLHLTDIALQLGYSDQSALARAYKAYKGDTLLQARKRIRS
jgi:AraC-like DNA-binding protein